MRRLFAGVALLCLLTSPAVAHDKDKPTDPTPPEIRLEPRTPEAGVAWWATDGRTRRGPYYALLDCQRAVRGTRLRCELSRD